MDLVFDQDQLKVYVSDKFEFNPALGVWSKRKGAEIFYEIVGEHLMVVGKVAPRPFEGFSFSGLYTKVQKQTKTLATDEAGTVSPSARTE